MGKKTAARRPRQGDLQFRAPQHGVGGQVPRPARPGDQVPGRGDRPEGRSARPGEQADHGDRSPDRHLRLDRRPLLGRHQGRADRRDRLFQLGRLLRQRDEERRLGHDHLRGPGRQAGLPLVENDKAQLLDAGDIWGTSVWDTEEHIKKKHQDPHDPGRLDRRLRREGRQVRLRRQRHAPRRRALRRRHRDGLEEPQGGRDPRHPGGQGRGLQGLHEGDRGRQGGAGRQRGDRRGPADLRHPGADERHQRGRRPADPQPPGRAVRGRPDSRPRSHAREAGQRRQGQPGDQRACFGCTIACGRISQIERTHFTVVEPARSTRAPPAAWSTRRPGRSARPPASTISTR